jgi:hypothetical protein
MATVRQCSSVPTKLGATEYVEWIETAENGFYAEKQVGAFSFSLQYKPLDYVVLKDQPGAIPGAKQLKAGCEALADMQYFTFRVSGEKGGDLLKDDASSTDDFTERLAYFSAGMQKDVFLIEGNDTLSCLLFHFERSYGVDPRSTFVLGFPLGKADGAGGLPCVAGKQFLFDDHELGAGPVMISLNAQQLNQRPTLNLD